MVDSGVENLDEEVDLLVANNIVRRVIAQIEVRESNSMIGSSSLQGARSCRFLLRPLRDYAAHTLAVPLILT